MPCIYSVVFYSYRGVDSVMIHLNIYICICIYVLLADCSKLVKGNWLWSSDMFFCFSAFLCVFGKKLSRRLWSSSSRSDWWAHTHTHTHVGFTLQCVWHRRKPLLKQWSSLEDASSSLVSKTPFLWCAPHRKWSDPGGGGTVRHQRNVDADGLKRWRWACYFFFWNKIFKKILQFSIYSYSKVLMVTVEGM